MPGGRPRKVGDKLTVKKSTRLTENEAHELAHVAELTGQKEATIIRAAVLRMLAEAKAQEIAGELARGPESDESPPGP